MKVDSNIFNIKCSEMDLEDLYKLGECGPPKKRVVYVKNVDEIKRVFEQFGNKKKKPDDRYVE